MLTWQPTCPTLDACLSSLRGRVVDLQPDGGNYTLGLMKHFAYLIPVNGDFGAPRRRSKHPREALDVEIENLTIVTDWRMSFNQQLTPTPGHLHWNIDEAHLCPDRNELK
jgi:hypothetical protein